MITITINTVDVSSQIDWQSFGISNNLFSNPDLVGLDIVNPANKSYSPSAGDEIEVKDGSTVIFAGILIKLNKRMDGMVEVYELDFKDWTEELSTILVAENYQNETVEAIIADIFSDAKLVDYNGTTNVSDTTVITAINFDNISVSRVLDELAEMSSKNWYVAPNKSIYFFSNADIQAPFDLTDTNGNYNFESLSVEQDFTQIRNRVTIKGKGIEAVTVEDATSIASYGLREYFERDENVNATNEATQKANAVLDAYKDPIDVIGFETVTAGLYAGQQIQIDSTIRGISKTVNIETVEFTADSSESFVYSVKATSQRLGTYDYDKQEIETSVSIGDQGHLQDISFTAIDNETIQWSSGTISLSGGGSYSISAKASQVLTASHVIYLDPTVSETELQISTSYADGIGGTKIPLCYATKSGVSTQGADIFPVTFGGKIQIDGGTHITENSIITDNIAANAVSFNELAANSVQAVNCDISTLSSITANIGSITAGTITGVNIISSTDNNSIRLTNGNLFEFYYGGSRKTYMVADVSGDLSIHTLDDVLFILGGNSKLGIYGSAMRPAVDNAYDLGSPSLRFEDTYSVDVYTNEVHCGTYKGGGVTTEYNKDNNGRDVEWDSYGNKRMKCNQDGNLGIDGSYSDGGADFAEYFESVDGKKIPKGTSVILVGDKIQKAKQGEEPIGVISVTPTIIGNAGGSDTGTNWTGKYLKNEWGEYIMEKKEFWIKKKPTITHKREDVRQDDKRLAQFKKYKKNNPMSGWSDETTPPPNVTLKTAERRKVNPNWDKTKKYKERKDRDEWNVVGLLGRLKVKKGQAVGKNWIKLRDISPTASEYLIK